MLFYVYVHIKAACKDAQSEQIVSEQYILHRTVATQQRHDKLSSTHTDIYFAVCIYIYAHGVRSRSVGLEYTVVPSQS
jgi:hypothetical protein